MIDYALFCKNNGNTQQPGDLVAVVTDLDNGRKRIYYLPPETSLDDFNDWVFSTYDRADWNLKEQP